MLTPEELKQLRDLCPQLVNKKKGSLDQAAVLYPFIDDIATEANTVSNDGLGLAKKDFRDKMYQLLNFPEIHPGIRALLATYIADRPFSKRHKFFNIGPTHTTKEFEAAANNFQQTEQDEQKCRRHQFILDASGGVLTQVIHQRLAACQNTNGHSQVFGDLYHILYDGFLFADQQPLFFQVFGQFLGDKRVTFPCRLEVGENVLEIFRAAHRGTTEVERLLGVCQEASQALETLESRFRANTSDQEFVRVATDFLEKTVNPLSAVSQDFAMIMDACHAAMAQLSVALLAVFPQDASQRFKAMMLWVIDHPVIPYADKSRLVEAVCAQPILGPDQDAIREIRGVAGDRAALSLLFTKVKTSNLEKKKGEVANTIAKYFFSYNNREEITEDSVHLFIKDVFRFISNFPDHDIALKHRISDALISQLKIQGKDFASVGGAMMTEFSKVFPFNYPASPRFFFVEEAPNNPVRSRRWFGIRNKI